MSTPRIYRSAEPDVPVPKSSVFTFLLQDSFNEHDPNQKAYIDGLTGQTLTRAQTKDLSLRVAYGLRHLLARKRGDTILVFSPNALSYPIITFGGVAAGVRLTLANASYNARELAHQLKDSRASKIFVHPTLLKIALEALTLNGVQTPRDWIVIMGLGYEPELSKLKAHWRTMPELLDLGKLGKEEQFNGQEASETVYMCYSSGTTGLPKGVETMHTNMTSVINMYRVQLQDLYPPERDNVMLAVLPFFHIYGLTLSIHHCFHMGVPVVILPRFEPVSFLKTIETYNITVVMSVPPILVFLNSYPHLDKFNLKSLRILSNGAAPLPTSLANNVTARLKKLFDIDVSIPNGYGLTETSPGAHTLHISKWRSKLGSCGTLFPNLEARLIGEDGNDVPEGEPGELWLRGPVIMKGYINNKEATENSITKDGWFKTGDIAMRDSEGYYFIVGRGKELIKYKGFQVAPAELESILLKHPDIVDVGVIGVDDHDRATELPRAYVVPRGGMASVEDPAALKNFVQGIKEWFEPQVAKHKFLRGGIIPVPAIPKSPAGKILRREMHAWAKEPLKSKL